MGDSIRGILKIYSGLGIGKGIILTAIIMKKYGTIKGLNLREGEIIGTKTYPLFRAIAIHREGKWGYVVLSPTGNSGAIPKGSSVFDDVGRTFYKLLTFKDYERETRNTKRDRKATPRTRSGQQKVNT
jgi:hypothetical protein